jgi:predicted metalloendopeptidase
VSADMKQAASERALHSAVASERPRIARRICVTMSSIRAFERTYRYMLDRFPRGSPALSPETKYKALDKLSRLKVKIGHPNEWRDYSRLEIRPGELVGSVHNARMFDWVRRVARLNSQIDRNEWDTTPQTVNGDYSSSLNEVVLPAWAVTSSIFRS